jgi:hypothetical protein
VPIFFYCGQNEIEQRLRTEAIVAIGKIAILEQQGREYLAATAAELVRSEILIAERFLAPHWGGHMQKLSSCLRKASKRVSSCIVA